MPTKITNKKKVTKNPQSAMQSIGDILVKFNPLEDKYISREFQHFGYYMAEQLNDLKHRSIYMKLAKTMNRAVLEKALSYVKDANVKRKGALFMWKLKQMNAWGVKDQKEESGKGLSGKTTDDIPF